MASTRVTPARMQTDKFEINQLQSNIITAIAQIANQLVNTPANGQFLLNKALISGNNEITHNLGQIPVGYMVISQDAAANFYLVKKTNNTLTINASAPVNVSIFTF